MGVSLRKFAAMVGVTAGAISKAVREGRLTALKDGTIDPVAGRAEWAVVSNPIERPTGVAGSTNSTIGQQAAMAKALASSYQAKLLELEYKRRSGELIPVAEVEALVYEQTRKAREHLQNVAARLAPVMVGVTTTEESHRLLEAEMNRACDELVIVWGGDAEAAS